MQDIDEALERFAQEHGITRKEALEVIARDWLIGQGYLRADDGDEPDFSVLDSR